MKRRMMALLLAGVMGVGMMSGCGSSKSADSGKVVREESDEPIDVLNQDEKMKLSIVCLQGYTQPDSEMQKCGGPLQPGYRYHRTAGLVGCNIQNFPSDGR